MPGHDAYMLHIYRSRAVNGWQWSARVDDLHGCERRRFADPETLLAYLAALVRTTEVPGAATDDANGEDGGSARRD